jgi:hypothetical protein
MTVKDFLILCAGGDRQSLSRTRNTRERGRFAAIGATVVLTAVFATVAAAYVTTMVFGSTVVAIALAILWGALIFTIDRLLVSTLHRPMLPPDMPLIQRIRQQRSAFAAAIPRLLLAVLVTFPIATPLQLRLFESEIDQQLARDRAKAAANARAQLEREHPELATLRVSTSDFDRRIAAKEFQTEQLLKSMLDEPTGRLTGVEFERRREAYVRSREELNVLKRIGAVSRRRLQHLERDLQERSVALFLDRGSLLARMKAFYTIKSHNKTVAAGASSVALLFLLIQISPIAAILISGRGDDADFWEAVGAMSKMGRREEPPHNPTTVDGEYGSEATIESVMDDRGAPAQDDATTARRLRAFMCHCSEDKHVVRLLARRLESDGIDTWLDDEKILPGQHWHDEIIKAIRSAHAVVICLSNKAVQKSGYIQREMRFALDVATEQPEGAIFLIPAKLENCEVPSHFSDLQFVRLYDTQGYDLLLRGLCDRALQVGVASSA